MVRHGSRGGGARRRRRQRPAAHPRGRRRPDARRRRRDHRGVGPGHARDERLHRLHRQHLRADRLVRVPRDRRRREPVPVRAHVAALVGDDGRRRRLRDARHRGEDARQLVVRRWCRARPGGRHHPRDRRGPGPGGRPPHDRARACDRRRVRGHQRDGARGRRARHVRGQRDLGVRLSLDRPRPRRRGLPVVLQLADGRAAGLPHATAVDGSATGATTSSAAPTGRTGSSADPVAIG